MKLSDMPNPKAAAAAIEVSRLRCSSTACPDPSKDCNGHIVSAHTLSAEAMLRPVRRDGKLYLGRMQFCLPTGG
jgi:hypothetical protein